MEFWKGVRYNTVKCTVSLVTIMIFDFTIKKNKDRWFNFVGLKSNICLSQTLTKMPSYRQKFFLFYVDNFYEV